MARRGGSVPQGRFRRGAPLAGLAARTVCGRVVANVRESAGSAGAVARFDQRCAQRYAELLGSSRGVLMKAGQILSMGDTDRWGGGGFEPYLEALGRLQSTVPVMDPVLVAELLDVQLGAGAGQFAEFAPVPVAAASIGQVHRAVLDDGRQVAVKVQYPGVARAIEDDLANVELLATFLRVVTAGTAVRADLDGVARTAGARIREEVDYRHEAAMMAVFGELYRDHPFIRIPQVITEACGDQVLTMTYLDGMDWAQAQHADQDLKNTWAEVILRFAYSNRWLAGLLHADPNPGNYRFFADGTVGFLDFGCVQVLTETQRSCWFAMIRAVVEGRATELPELMAQAGFLEGDPRVSADELHQWWAELLHDIIVEPQPVTYTSAHRDRLVAGMFNFRDRNHLLSRLSVSGVGAVTARIQFNLVSICAALGATLPVRSIADDMDGVAEPVTMLGQQHQVWMRERGLAGPSFAPGEIHRKSFIDQPQLTTNLTSTPTEKAENS
ncbi:putative ABC transporter ATP-binding protein [Mycolicibacterium cyprinidarum]|uniref:ABC transporter ATP-binding protein n=1 Tax=Mycolicibacterium cyprinidarum TaxID=2860311 RepID=A0ABQ4VEV1_9MYCO|nr:putative ABC transporter ATP-binding protein [Mycolicibacterium sp. NGTWS0302]GJF12830.1 putative ABC transporter ATP-binding protein [Mycolicibacterium sp. NGTWSNA01]